MSSSLAWERLLPDRVSPSLKTQSRGGIWWWSLMWTFLTRCPETPRTSWNGIYLPRMKKGGDNRVAALTLVTNTLTQRHTYRQSWQFTWTSYSRMCNFYFWARGVFINAMHAAKLIYSKCKWKTVWVVMFLIITHFMYVDLCHNQFLFLFVGIIW